MLKLIQAYFPTENEAEAARTSLLTYETEKVEVSKLGAKEDEADSRPDPEIGVLGVSAGNAGVGATDGGVGGQGGFVVTASNDGNKYVLSAKVKEEDYDEIVEIIDQNQGELE